MRQTVSNSEFVSTRSTRSAVADVDVGDHQVPSTMCSYPTSVRTCPRRLSRSSAYSGPHSLPSAGGSGTSSSMGAMFHVAASECAVFG